MPDVSPPTSQPKRDWLLAAAIFIIAAAAVQWLFANRFFLTLDEGIYLSGAQRILRGEIPFRDFFAITGPGAFWIEAGLFSLFGKTLAVARISLALDLGVLTGCVYWLTSRLSTRRVAIIITAFFFAFETRPMFRLYVNHRWDSAALALLAIALAFEAMHSTGRTWWFGAGLIAAAAAWVTPSMLWLVLALALWLLASRELRLLLLPYFAGIVLVSITVGGVLLAQDALGPMFRDLVWTAQHYGAANRVPYGYGAIGPGGLAAIFAGAHGGAILARATGLISVLLPVVLPPLVYVLWLLRNRAGLPDERRRSVLLLLVCSIALLFSAWPRWSADQLLFIAPIFYALAGYLIVRRGPGHLPKIIATACLVILAAAAFSYSSLQVFSEPEFETRIGQVRASTADQQFIRFATHAIQPGQTVFAYPYLPLIYFVTGARNPVRYSFLQPGMMTADDYASALTDLRTHPPQWIFYFPIRRIAARIWPASAGDPPSSGALETYISHHYHAAGEMRSPSGHFVILERN